MFPRPPSPGRSLAASILAAATLLAGCSDPRPLAPGEYRLDSRAVDESSGLARSQRDPQRLWTLNDSGDDPVLYALDTRGHALGRLRIAGAANEDWEDLASYDDHGTPTLLVADVGGNIRRRPSVTLYWIEEPDSIPAPGTTGRTTVSYRTLRVRFPDGPRDCEAVAVDVAAGRIYLLSKRDPLPRLYAVPLDPQSESVTAEALGEIRIPRAPAHHPHPEYIDWISAMDISPDGRSLVAVSLTQAHVYRRRHRESWPQALRRAPTSFGLPPFEQIEAVTWAADGRAIYVSSEGRPMPLARIELRHP